MDKEARFTQIINSITREGNNAVNAANISPQHMNDGKLLRSKSILNADKASHHHGQQIPNERNEKAVKAGRRVRSRTDSELPSQQHRNNHNSSTSKNSGKLPSVHRHNLIRNYHCYD